MEKEYQISWLKIVGVTALIAIIVVIICLVYPKKDTTLLTQQTYIDNITLMKDAGFEYFKGSNLPKEIGDSERISLDEMIARNLIVEFLDEEGNTCNVQNSYIEATKTLDNEYEMSIYLSCNNKSDYIITSINNEVVCTDCTSTANPSDEDDNDTISDNTNNNNSNSSGNGPIRPIYDDNNSSSSSNNRPINITQTTNVNIDYVNTCCTDGNSSNCNDNCLANVYHSVIFDTNGGSVVQTQTVKHGDVATYKTTYRAGYIFLGWYLDGEEYDFSTPVTKKIVLEAKWKKKESQEDKDIYLVEFDSNGGTSVDDQEVVEGDTATRPKDPTRHCYEFAGWYIDSSLTKKYDFSTPVTSDMTLYAKWVDDGSCKETYTVRFDSNGGTRVSSQTVEEGDRAYEPNDPTRNGYTFLGWYLNGRKFNFSTRIYEDITLEAKWEKEEEKYYTYCKIDTERYYSISYVSASEDTWDYDWTIRLDALRNVEDVELVKTGYLTSTAMYNNAYNHYYDQNISMVDGKYQYGVTIPSATKLKTYSLQSSNFNKYLSNPYYRSGKWYIDASVSIKNYNNVKSYYAGNIDSSIYFVPFYFDLEYVDMNRCVDDKASNSYKYDDYKIVDSYFK